MTFRRRSNLSVQPLGHDLPLNAPLPSSPALLGLTDLQRDLRRGLPGVVVPQLAPPLAVMDEVDRDVEEGRLVVEGQRQHLRRSRSHPLQP